MYESLAVWETDATPANQSDLMADYVRAWNAADNVVYSSTRAAPRTQNSRLERRFDPLVWMSNTGFDAPKKTDSCPRFSERQRVIGGVFMGFLRMWHRFTITNKEPGSP